MILEGTFEGWFRLLSAFFAGGLLPVLAFVALWSAIAPGLVSQSVLASPAAADLPAFGFQRQTILNEARAVATGAAPAVFNPQAAGLVEPFREALSHYNLIGIVVTLLITTVASLYKTRKDARRLASEAEDVAGQADPQSGPRP